MIQRNFNALDRLDVHSRANALGRWPFSPLRPVTARPRADVAERGEWCPAVDIRETDSQYAIDVELPGVAKDDVSVEFDDGVLTIKGEKKRLELADGERLNRSGRSYGTFTRTFRLPADADDDQLRALYQNGILSVEIPRQETPKPRNVEID
jgi:HSP20 family protein